MTGFALETRRPNSPARRERQGNLGAIHLTHVQYQRKTWKFGKPDQANILGCEVKGIKSIRRDLLFQAQTNFWWDQVSASIVSFMPRTASKIEGVAAG